MKKTIIAALIALCCAYSSATQILWAGIDENAIVHIGDQAISIVDWMSALACAPIDVGGRIRIGDSSLPAGYEDPSGYVPPGQMHPSIIFDDDICEFGLHIVDDNDEPTGIYADWQPIKLTVDSPSHTEIFFDIGYWDENADWAFVSVATATAYLDDIWNAHTYTAGTLAPPVETPWRPTDFHAIVPEPSTIFLALLGVGMLFNKRRNAK